jgi:transposase
MLSPTIMYLKKTVSGNNTYYSIARSYQDENGSIQTEYIQKLGKLSDEEVERWRSLIKNSGRVSNSNRAYVLDPVNLPEDTICYRSWRHGVCCLVSSLWEEFGFQKIISESLSHVPNKSFVANLVEAMVVNRLEDPCSKLRLLEWLQKDTSLQFLIDLPPPGVELNENHFYRAMDFLWEKRDVIEKKIYEEIVKPMSSGAVLAKDITSTYFEGNKSSIAKYGYSRDHRNDRKQVNWSLIETEEGFPITLEIYPGNIPDKNTVKESIRRIKELFGITSGIFVMDRGMATEENIQAIVEEGFRYVVAEKLDQKSILKVVDDAFSKGLDVLLTDENGNQQQLKLPIGDDDSAATATQRVLLRGREIVVTNDDGNKPSSSSRYIVLYNPQKEKEDLESLQRDLSLGEQILSKVQKYAMDHPKKVGSDPMRVIKMAVRHLEAKKLSSYFDVKSWDPVQKKLAYELKQKKVENDRKYAGVWVLRTNVPAEEKQPLEIVNLYKGLGSIEHTFREIKSSLDLRPMWHRNPDRVKAHIWICAIAYLIEKIVEDKVRRRKIADDDNMPITGIRAIQSFRTIMLNEVGLRAITDYSSSPSPITTTTRMRWWLTTELDDGHQPKILEALGIDKSAFKLRRGLIY